jgi:hypothetical protein
MGRIDLAKFERLHTSSPCVLAQGARAENQANEAIKAIISETTFLSKILPVVPRRDRIATMEGSTFVTSSLRSGFGIDPWSTDNAAQTDWNIFEAAKDTAAVLQGHG